MSDFPLQSPSTKIKDTTDGVKPMLYFHELFPHLLKGHEFTRKEWDDERIVVKMVNGHLSICLPQNGYKPCDLIVSDGDILAQDFYQIN